MDTDKRMGVLSTYRIGSESGWTLTFEGDNDQTTGDLADQLVATVNQLIETQRRVVIAKRWALGWGLLAALTTTFAGLYISM